MISTSSRSSHLRSVRQGFSLIEVAIALVIFVIGALAIIRIFPGALSVIGNNGDQQIATNLNRSAIATLQSEQVVPTPTPGPTPSSVVAARVAFNSVPDATFNNSNANGTLSIDSWMGATPSANHSVDFRDADSSVIGVQRFNNTLPTPEEIATGSSISSLSRYRAILGERALIKNLNVGGTLGKYALTQFPVSIQLQGTPSLLLPVKPVVSQEYVLNDVRTTPNGTLDFSRYRLDNSDDITTIQGVNAGSMLYVSYRYLDSSGTVWGVQEEALPITTANLRADVSLKVKPTTDTNRRDAARVTGSIVTNAVVPEIVEVKLRSFLGQGEFGDMAATPAKQVSDARRGLVLLPGGLDETRPVILDYIADWSFLLQDGVPLITPNANYPALPPSPPSPPNLTYRQLALGAPFIEEQAPYSVYSLLIESDVVYQSGFGTELTEPPSVDRLVRANDPEQRDDELRAGKVTFIVENSASRARVAYQTRSNWVQQLSVAANSYKPFSTGGTSIEPWRDYYLGGDNYLYFHAGEAGKTISVSYRTTDDNGPLVDRPFVIETQLANAPAGFYNGLAARAKLTDKDGNRLPDNTTGAPNLITIQAVEGSSVTVRTAYINGTKYAQTLLTSNRGAK